jgi:hypothetical protein
MALGKIPDSSPRPGQAAPPPAGRIRINRRRRGLGGGRFRSAPCHPSPLHRPRRDFVLFGGRNLGAHVRGTAEVEGLGRIKPKWPWGRYPIAPRGQVRPPPPVCRRRIEFGLIDGGADSAAARFGQRLATHHPLHRPRRHSGLFGGRNLARTSGGQQRLYVDSMGQWACIQ